MQCLMGRQKRNAITHINNNSTIIIDKGKYMYDLKTENKYDECFIYRRFKNGILRITNPRCNKEAD